MTDISKQPDKSSTNISRSEFTITFTVPEGRAERRPTPEQKNETAFITSSICVDALLFAISTIGLECTSSDNSETALNTCDYLALIALGFVDKMREQYAELQEMAEGKNDQK